MTQRNEIKDILEKYPQYREKLFFNGFVFSNQSISLEGYPFYGEWQCLTTKNGSLLCHKHQKYYFQGYYDYS